MDGMPVLRVADAPAARCHPVLVAVVTSPYSQIRNSLHDAGWNSVLPFYDYAQCFASVHPLNNGWFAGPLSDQDQLEIRHVLDQLSDPISQASYLQFLAWRILREEWCFNTAPVHTHNRYFIPEVVSVLTEREDVVDCGAYDGRFALHLLKHTNGGFNTLRLFEPDPANVSLLQQNLAALSSAQRGRLRIIDRALSDTSGAIPFSYDFGMMSRLCAEASSTVSAVRLDDMAVSPTYLKIHVEGSELSVLAGAAETLKKYRPIIAVTVYHNRDGLWRIPCYLMKLVDSYHFLFRLHTWCGTGAVLYGIPDERQLHNKQQCVTNTYPATSATSNTRG
jgi:FkbM family methyltransferase